MNVERMTRLYPLIYSDIKDRLDKNKKIFTHDLYWRKWKRKNLKLDEFNEILNEIYLKTGIQLEKVIDKKALPQKPSKPKTYKSTYASKHKDCGMILVSYNRMND